MNRTRCGRSAGRAAISGRQKLGVLPAQTYSTSQRAEKGVDGHPLGKLPGSVWELATQPLKVPSGLEVEHHAAFPPPLPMRIIAGWSPPGICTACGEGRRPAVEKPGVSGHNNNPDGTARSTIMAGAAAWGQRMRDPDRITGHVCACPTPDAPTRPSLVIDPFGGTGTTALAALALGRRGVSFDLSTDYCRLAQWRTSDSGELARALGKPKPPAPVTGQLDMFGESA